MATCSLADHLHGSTLLPHAPAMGTHILPWTVCIMFTWSLPLLPKCAPPVGGTSWPPIMSESGSNPWSTESDPPIVLGSSASEVVAQRGPPLSKGATSHKTSDTSAFSEASGLGLPTASPASLHHMQAAKGRAAHDQQGAKKWPPVFTKSTPYQPHHRIPSSQHCAAARLPPELFSSMHY